MSFDPSTMSNAELMNAIQASQAQPVVQQSQQAASTSAQTTQESPPQASQSGQSGGFDPSKMSDQDLMKAINTSQPQQTTPSAAEDPITGRLLAGVGGISNAAMSTVETLNDSGYWLANKLGLISDNTLDKLKAQAKQDTNILRSSPDGDQNDIFNKAAATYPNTAQGLEKTADVAWLVSTPMTKSLIANAAINGVISAGIGDQNADWSFVLGAGVTIAAKPLEMALTSLAKSSNVIPQAVQTYLNPVMNKLADDNNMSVGEKALKAEAANTATILNIKDSLYAPIKQIPGTIDPKPIIEALTPIAKNSNADVGLIQQAMSLASNMTNMEDALKLRSTLSEALPDFLGSAKTQVKSVIANIDDAINNKAVSAGLGKALSKANAFYTNQVDPLIESGSLKRLQVVSKNVSQQAYASSNNIQPIMSTKYASAAKTIFPANMSPEQLQSVGSRLGKQGNQLIQDHFMEQVFKEAGANPLNSNPNTMLMNVNKILNDYKTVLTPETKQTFNGLKTLLEEAGAKAKTASYGTIGSVISSHPYVAGSLIGSALGGTAGAVEGYQSGGDYSHALYGLLGGAAMGFAWKGLVETTNGQAVLRFIANHPEVAHGVVNNAAALVVSPNNSGSNIGQDEQSNQYQPTQSNQ